MRFTDLPKVVQHTIQTHDAVRTKFHDQSEEERFFTVVNKTAQELALYFANYECEKCKATEGLTYHHLINRVNKTYMRFGKYIRQRHDYRNSAILCKRCHAKVEGHNGDRDEKVAVISQERIDEVQKRLGRPVVD